MNKVAAVISYCTHDYRFIGKCIEEAEKFSDQIIIPVCDHFYNGTPENRFLLERTFLQHPDCQFIEFAYGDSPYMFDTSRETGDRWACLWHATARYIGFLHLDPQIEYVLFLDCDEIIEGDRFAEWLALREYEKYNAMRLCCYYYVLRCNWRAQMWQELTLFARKQALFLPRWIQPADRYGLFHAIAEPKARDVCAPFGKPFLHHYSWVRSREENLHKAASWGHQNFCDWTQLIQNSFEGKKLQEFFGANFDFEQIPNPYFDPLSISVPAGEASALSFPHVKKTDRRSILKKELGI